MPFPEDLSGTKSKTRDPGKGVTGRSPVHQKVRGDQSRKKSCSSHKGPAAVAGGRKPSGTASSPVVEGRAALALPVTFKCACDLAQKGGPAVDGVGPSLAGVSIYELQNSGS